MILWPKLYICSHVCLGSIVLSSLVIEEEKKKTNWPLQELSALPQVRIHFPSKIFACTFSTSYSFVLHALSLSFNIIKIHAAFRSQLPGSDSQREQNQIGSCLNPVTFMNNAISDIDYTLLLSFEKEEILATHSRRLFASLESSRGKIPGKWASPRQTASGQTVRCLWAGTLVL